MDEASIKSYMQEAIRLAEEGMNHNEGGPFGAIIVRDNVIIGRGNNKVLCNNDPTAHAEVVAIRQACEAIGDFQLTDCIVFTSCEPCPMCMAALYWARVKKIYYACTRMDAAAIQFDDAFIYEEIQKDIHQRAIEAEQVDREIALKTFEAWKIKVDKKRY